MKGCEARDEAGICSFIFFIEKAERFVSYQRQGNLFCHD